MQRCAAVGVDVDAVALPHVARQLTGLEPDTPEFVERYSGDLARLVERLLA